MFFCKFSARKDLHRIEQIKNSGLSHTFNSANTLQLLFARGDRYPDTIQSYRYDNAIHVTYEFAPEIMEKKMVKLLLQPLVENAIIHGLETFSGKKCLRIRGYLDKQLLVFEIENNGKIPDLDRIRKILSGQQQITKSYGIWNVNERIKAAYGARYGLRYYQREDWVVANITIPAEPMY